MPLGGKSTSTSPHRVRTPSAFPTSHQSLIDQPSDLQPAVVSVETRVPGEAWGVGEQEEGLSRMSTSHPKLPWSPVDVGWRLRAAFRAPRPARAAHLAPLSPVRLPLLPKAPVLLSGPSLAQPTLQWEGATLSRSLAGWPFFLTLARVPGLQPVHVCPS